jgi:hypothetical protein
MKKLLIGGLLLLQTACTSYQYIEPITEEGKYCVKNCLNRKWDCSSSCQINYSHCLASNSVNISLFNNYQGENQINPYQEKSRMCERAKNDCESSCWHNYNPCFTSCGGTIIEK